MQKVYTINTHDILLPSYPGCGITEPKMKGYRVFATARNLSAVQELSEKYSIETIQLDVTSTPSVRAARDEVARLTGGKLDILVNNAYVYPYSVPLEHSELTYTSPAVG